MRRSIILSLPLQLVFPDVGVSMYVDPLKQTRVAAAIFYSANVYSPAQKNGQKV
jgi:hypothetical protein